MINMDIKRGTKVDFRKQAKKYVINMMKNSRKTLHIKNTKSCYASKCVSEYVDFDTLEEVEKSSSPFVKCQNCFKK